MTMLTNKPKLQTLVLMYFVVGALIPLIFMGGGVYFFQRSEISSGVSLELEALAQTYEARLVEFYERSVERVSGVASRTQLRISLANLLETGDEQEKQRVLKIIQDAKDSISDFEEITIVNNSGFALASTSTNKEEMWYDTREAFIKGMSGPSITAENEHAEMYYLSAPLILDNETLGVVIIVSSIGILHEISTDYDGLEQTGDILIARRNMAGDAVFVSPRRFSSDKDSQEIIYQEQTNIPITQALAKNERIFFDTIDYRGEHVVSATRYIEELDWGLVIKKDKEEVFSPINEFIFIFIGFLLLSFILVIVSSLILSKKVTGPVTSLHRGMKEIRKGNYEVNISSTNQAEELIELEEMFNEAAQKLRQLESERDQLEKAKTEFLSISSHELRSPMTSMKSYLQMLIKGYFKKLNAEQKEAIQIVLNNTNRLDNILLDMLEVSRIEAARLRFKFIKTNLRKEVESLVKEMEEYLPKKNVSIDLRMGKLPTFRVDPNRVMQVLRNLMNNAIKFSSANSKVEVFVKRKGEEIEFSVKDFGIGIAEKNKKHIFDPFFQEEKTMYRKYGGTGLGLVVCKGIVESQNGRIWVESKKDAGSTFSFTVPLKPVERVKPISLMFSTKKKNEKK